MAVAVRFFREDLRERIRLVSAAMPNTPLSFIGTGMRFITWTPADEDVIRLVFRCIVRNGIRRIQIVDPSNDPARLRRIAVVARGGRRGDRDRADVLRQRGAHVAYYAERAAALADCAELDRLYLKDPGGLLTPDAVRELAPHFIAAARGRTIELHTTARSGSRRSCTWRASGPASTCCTRPSARWRGTSNPAVETTLRNLEAEGYPTGSTRTPWRQSRSTSRPSPRSGAACRPAAGVRRDVLPPSAGPAAWSRRRSACSRSCARPELFLAVLEEVACVRAEMGYPIIVTPVSQFVATQAVRNILDGERWATVSDETVRYFLGHYGEPAAPVDPEVADRVLSRPRASELRHLEPLSLEGRERASAGRSRTRSCCCG